MSGSVIAPEHVGSDSVVVPIGGWRPSDAVQARVAAVLDRGTWRQLDGGADDGVVAGHGAVRGRGVLVWAQDPSYRGGSLGARGGALIARVIEHADRLRRPVIGLVDSGGARIQEGVRSLTAYARIFRAQSLVSTPQLSIICGTCAGGGAYSPALGDLVVMVDGDARMFLTGPRVIWETTREEITAEQLGGARIHARTGVVHLTSDNLLEASRLVGRVLEHLPVGGALSARTEPRAPMGRDPARALPELPRQVYDIRDLAGLIVDGGDLLELAPRWAKNLVVGLARLDGWPVGVIANQPRWLGGTLDADAAEKGEWFVRLCDRLRLPLAVLVDTPGFMPGAGQERAGVIRRGAGLVRAFAQATVPRATVTVRAAYGGAHIAMNSRELGACLTLAWPGAKIGVMGARQAVEIIDRRAIAAGDDVDALADAYAAEHLPAERALALGAIDEIVAPARTRERLIAALTSR